MFQKIALLILYILCIALGIMIFPSLSHWESLATTTALVQRGYMSVVDSALYYDKQLRNYIVSALVGVLFFCIPTRYIIHKLFAKVFYGLALLCILLSLISGWGVSIAGGQGWLAIPGLPTFDTVPFYILGSILLLKIIITHTSTSNLNYIKEITIEKKHFTFKRILPTRLSHIESRFAGHRFVTLLVIQSCLCLPLVILDDGSSLVILWLVSTSMIVAYHRNTKYIITLVGTSIVAIVSLLYNHPSIVQQFSQCSHLSTIQKRYNVGCYNQKILQKTHTTLRGVGSYQGSIKKSLPVMNEFAFASIGEEFGIVSQLVVSGIYLLIIITALRQLRRKEIDSSSLILIGLGSWWICTIAGHILTNTGYFPVVGFNLPFVSYGLKYTMIWTIVICLLIKLQPNYKSLS